MLQPPNVGPPSSYSICPNMGCSGCSRLNSCPVVFTCVLNQSRGHWLLGDALNATISLSLQFSHEVVVVARQMPWASQDFDADLEKLSTMMRQEAIEVLAPFFSFLS